MRKISLSADQLLRDSFTLALKVLHSGYRPNVVVGVWRGGTPVGIAVHEAFEYVGLSCRHLPIRTSSYRGIGIRDRVVVAGLEGLVEMCEKDTRILLVDDVFDSGQTMARIHDELLLLCDAQMPEVRIAVPWYKPLQNTTKLTPDFWLHETADWLIFPHELCDLDDQDVLGKPGTGDLAAELLEFRNSNTPPGDS